MDATHLATIFVTLFVIIDPIAVAPIFVALTSGMEPERRRASALRAAIVATCVLTAFGLFGEAILRAIGISIDAFRISGGLLLFLIAVEMLFEKRTQRRSNAHSEEGHDPSVFPVAVPLMAGPGAMATMVLLAAEPGATWGDIAALHAVMAVVVFITFVFCLAGSWLEKFIGANGINVLTRLFGILLAALAVQIVLDGLSAYGLVHG
jgi:multiple antibiotic resistance protein